MDELEDHWRDFESKEWKMNTDEGLKDLFWSSKFVETLEIELALQWRWFQVVWSCIEGFMIKILHTYQYDIPSGQA